MSNDINNNKAQKANAPERDTPKGKDSVGPAAPAPKKKHFNRPLCRTSEYMPPGSRQLGLAPNNQPSKVVWELDYGLSEAQFKALTARFPGIAFVQTGFDCHDHPIAHTSYRVVWENVMRKLKPGSLVADVDGNPAYNEVYNHRQVKRDRPIQVDTFCQVLSPKDSIRAKTRWGPKVADGKIRWEEMTLYDMYRNDANRARFAKYDVFLFNHSLYYYTFADINKLLALNPNAVGIATLHKLPGAKGEINCGEQEYEKDLMTGNVIQTNKETGEFYEHPDPAKWFRQFCYADEHGAMAWTVNKGCDDTYVITVTSTEPKLVPEKMWLGGRIFLSNGKEAVNVDPSPSVVSDPPPAYAQEEVVFTTRDLVPGYAASKEKRIKITHPELYKKLSMFMVNKPRNPRTLADLTAKAHRETGHNALVANVKPVDISPRALSEHVFAAWMSGVHDEAVLFEAALTSSPSAASVNRNLGGRTLAFGPATAPKQFTRMALSILSIAKSKDPVHEVLAQVDELF